MDLDQVITRRFATQRLTGPAAASPAEAVRELLAVQAQDAPLARAMIAYRSRPGTAASVSAAVARGELVRTHILRPTWHYVAAADLRWLLALTSPPEDAPMSARDRQLGLTHARIEAAIAAVAERLAGRQFAVRKALGEALAAAGVVERADPLFGQQVGHLLGYAEYRAVICSAPVEAAEHHYALVDEVVAPTPSRTREEALTELVGRFLTSHGPVALTDLQRWTKLTLADIRRTIAALEAQVTSAQVDGAELWYAPAEPVVDRPRRAWLLSIFDEAVLTYTKRNFLRSSGHPSGDRPYPFNEAGGGVVLCDGRDVGAWTRRMVKGTPQLTLDLDPGLTAGQRAAVDDAADLLAATITG